MIPFWQIKSLENLTPEEWDSLCDRCGLCCRLKDRDGRTGRILNTQICCRLLDTETCLCSNYENRHKLIPDCIDLTPENVPDLDWLPSSCAYRLLAAGHDLPDWHPLVTGDPESAHNAGFSVRDRVVSEEELFATRLPEDQ